MQGKEIYTLTEKLMLNIKLLAGEGNQAAIKELHRNFNYKLVSQKKLVYLEGEYE